MGRVAIAVGVGLGLLVTSGCVVRGNGVVTEEDRAVSSFVNVQNDSSVDTSVEEGSTFKVTVRLDSNLQGDLTTQLVGNTLVITSDSKSGLIPSSGTGITITLPSFQGGTASASGDLDVSNILASKDVTLKASGSGEVSFTGPAAHVIAKADGSGSITLSGTADLLDVNVSGSGGVDAQSTMTASANLVTSGSGGIVATLNGGTVTFDISGSGDITWYGTATVAQSKSSGSGQVQHAQ